ncbi:MAG: hypothetical protein ACREM6_11950 [Vulcanimicrobiaceae bacterium]
MKLTFSRFTIALAAAAMLAASAGPSFAAMGPKDRFSSGHAYTGGPDLPVTLSMIVAGGGPSDFDSVKLVGVLAGAKTAAEVAKLKKPFGAENVGSFLKVFNFVVSDSLAKVTAAKVALPSTPNPDPKDGKALSAALYKLGVNSQGKFNVEYMLDGLVSHPIHVAVMNDIDAKFGRAADANYHVVLTQAMEDLKAVYGL